MHWHKLVRHPFFAYMHKVHACHILAQHFVCLRVCIIGILTQQLSLLFDDKTRDRMKLQILFPFSSLCPLIQSSLSTQCAVDDLLPLCPSVLFFSPSFSDTRQRSYRGSAEQATLTPLRLHIQRTLCSTHHLYAPLEIKLSLWSMEQLCKYYW